MPSVCDCDANDGNDDELEMDLGDDNIFDVLGCRNEHHKHHAAPTPAYDASRRKSVQLHRREMAMTRPLMVKAARKVSMSKARQNWIKLSRKARCVQDPWQEFHIEAIPEERCLRYRYNAVKKTWTTDEVVVKMESKPFNRGAMRECFRLKKLSTFIKSRDWANASNYVAKSYMEDVDADVYRSDIQLQMLAKLWGQHYNRSDPPKQVDIMQMCLLECVEREGRPLFHLEHFIEGTYIKYNSNSGFVEEQLRNTPQAFSHFTFERSGHKLIVVDIQGVGDLYTDPQIHTADGTEYGDGNLGPRGMALFFHSHVCNAICESLHLTPFDMAPSEEEERDRIIASASNSAPGTVLKSDLCEFSPPIRCRTRYDSGVVSSPSEGDGDASSASPTGISPNSPFERPRRRLDTSNSDMDLSLNVMTREDVELWHQQQCHFHRPSRIHLHVCGHDEEAATHHNVLGSIHHEMARFHEVGRFLADREHDPVDWDSALFHEKMAADHGFLEALQTMARYFLGLQHDVLAECPIKAEEDDQAKGIMYMTRAAEAGDRASMIFLAESYQRGQFGCERDWVLASRWYAKAVDAADDCDASGGYDATMDTPLYELEARLADMLLSGGHGLDRDPSSAGDHFSAAADGAMNAMKGRRATRLYELAEEAYGEAPDPDE